MVLTRSMACVAFIATACIHSTTAFAPHLALSTSASRRLSLPLSARGRVARIRMQPDRSNRSAFTRPLNPASRTQIGSRSDGVVPLQAGKRGYLEEQSSSQKSSMVYWLVLVNAVVFALQAFPPLPMELFYLNHRNPQLLEYITSIFCHANLQHLSSNMFPLLVFGRLVEDELGSVGLLLTYLICGASAGFASVALNPGNVVSLGASGAIFGLFTVSILSRLGLKEFRWQGLIEAVVFGGYVWQQLRFQITPGGVPAGVDTIAHLGGAAAGVAMITFIKLLLGILESNVKE